MFVILRCSSIFLLVSFLTTSRGRSPDIRRTLDLFEFDNRAPDKPYGEPNCTTDEVPNINGERYYKNVCTSLVLPDIRCFIDEKKLALKCRRVVLTTCLPIKQFFREMLIASWDKNFNDFVTEIATRAELG